MFDNDATVLKHLDHLFLLPPAPLAIPRAYWLGADPLPEKTIHKYVLSGQLLVVTPDPVVFAALMDAVRSKGENDYDMEILNWVLGPVALVLPHRALNLLSGEFRREHKPGYKGYDRYLGITKESWNARKVLDEAYYVHFSDWPNPKVYTPTTSPTVFQRLTGHYDTSRGIAHTRTSYPKSYQSVILKPQPYQAVVAMSRIWIVVIKKLGYGYTVTLRIGERYQSYVVLASSFLDINSKFQQDICGLGLLNPPFLGRRLSSEPQWDV